MVEQQQQRGTHLTFKNDKNDLFDGANVPRRLKHEKTAAVDFVGGGYMDIYIYMYKYLIQYIYIYIHIYV